MSRLCVRVLAFCHEEKGWRSSTIPPAYPFFAQSRPLLTGHPRGRHPATQQTLIDCDSSVQGKRSCQALETNSGSRAQKTQFPWPNFRLVILQAVVLQRALTRNSCTAFVASRSRKPIVNLGTRPQPRTQATGHRLFARIPRMPSHGVDANPSAVSARNELSFGLSSVCNPSSSKNVNDN